jgi:CRP-like cAMP-binding protein
MNIRIADMHIRDERVHSWLLSKGGELRITHHEIARHFGCSRVTALHIMARLERAGFVSVISRGRRGGNTYRIHHAP